MTQGKRTLLTVVASAALGAAIGGFVTYGAIGHLNDLVSDLRYDGDVRELMYHQRIVEELDEGDSETAVQLLESAINGEIIHADMMLTADWDGLTDHTRELASSALKHISDYRARPEFKERVQYVTRDEPGDPNVQEILARYQSDAP